MLQKCPLLADHYQQISISIQKLENDVNFQASISKQVSASTTTLHNVPYANDTRSRNRRQKTGVGFWRVCHTIWCQIFLAPDSGVG